MLEKLNKQKPSLVDLGSFIFLCVKSDLLGVRKAPGHFYWSRNVSTHCSTHCFCPVSLQSVAFSGLSGDSGTDHSTDPGLSG